ncbi:NAD-dependent aldehyde dehydrogenase [Fusarium proliferatum]|nr:NAD-dependent aldehyde dehydrogenase [Fusarium proliferatum]
MSSGDNTNSWSTIPFIINGKDVTSKASFPVNNPASSEKLWSGSSASISDATGAVEAAQAAFASWSQTKPSFRRDILFRAADLFISRKEELFAYQAQETGAGRQFMEINIKATAQILRDIGGRIEAALEGSVPATAEQGSHAIVVKEPYGVVLAIAPWNAPYVLGARSVAFALATGNTTVLKGSELSPRVFWAIGDVFRHAGLPDGCLNVIYHRTADAAAVTDALIAHPAIKKINFTGSTLVGSIIASLAGKHVKPLLLELGGKASAIVLKDADVKKAATSCAVGAFIHGGQVCMSTERILVHRSISDEFSAALKEATQGLFGPEKPPFVLVNSAAVQKNRGLIADAVAKGATTLLGDADAAEDQPTKMRPVIVSNVSKEMNIYHTESFGPTVSLLTFDTEEEALAVANDTDYGLSGAVFSEDLKAAMRVARKYETGAVHINSMTVHDEAALVHGGAKKSGYGRFNASQGLAEFLRKDVIVRHTRNFHHGLGNRKSSGFRGRRRTNSHPGASRPRGSKNASAQASPAPTTARGQQNRHSEGLDHVIEERDESPTNNQVDGSQSSQANSLDIAMPSQPDMFPPYISGSPLEFNASFMDPELINTNLSAIFDLDALLADAQGLFGQVSNCNPPEIPILALEPPIPNRPAILDQSDNPPSPRNLVPNDDKCENAWANLTKYPVHILASLRFPSKYARNQHERMVAFNKADPETLTWMLQTYLLLAYFEIHCGSEGKRGHAFPHCVKLVQEALSDLQTSPPATYKDWVRWESLNRCISSTILIGGTVCSKEQEAWIPTPMVEARFALPSSNAEWLKEESSWGTPTEILYSNDALDSIIGGQIPSMPVSEFGLVTIAAALLYRICSFELLTGSRDGELYAEFGKKMEQSLKVLDAILKARMVQYEGGLAPNPTVHCARSLLNSAFYHLYASVPLSVMKKILSSPASLDDPEIRNVLNVAISPELYQALLNAADQLQFDCRVGLSYIKKLAPIIFGPESAVGALEGCLLLCWYLQFAQPRISEIGSRDILNASINESFAEVEDLQLEDHGLQAVLPLAVSAELLSDGSVWKSADVYFRKTKTASKLPIALHFHGGNFTVGSKKLLSRDQSERLLDLGFVVVSANYRLAPTVTVFEGAVKDALDAYEWSRTKLPGLLLEDAHIKADGSRIVTLGHSCGGTLALLTASSIAPPCAILDIYGIKYLADSAFHIPLPAPPGTSQIDQDFASQIWKDDQPPTSAPPPVGPKGPNLGNYRVAWMFDQLAKGTQLKTVVGDGDYGRIDPASLLSKGQFPPTVFIHGTEDRLVPARLSQRAHDELKSNGIETELFLVEGGQHGFDDIGRPENALELLGKGFEFLKAHV